MSTQLPTVGERKGALGRAADAITVRAVLCGGLSAAALVLINPHLAFISRTWSVGDGSLLSSPLVVLFAFVLLNGLLLRLWPGTAFTRGELIVIYGMLIVSVGFSMEGGAPYLVSATTYPFYMAQPENGWQHSIWPHIPTWLRLGTPEANVWFWEGLPPGAGVPWAAWARPLMAWGSFTLALMAGMYCLGALMSRDWIERQRLAFPLVDVPLAITGEGATPSLRQSILNNRVFWLGFAVPASLSLLGWLHRLFPSVPAVQLYALQVGRYFSGMGLPWSALSSMQISILFPIIGIGCLLPGEVSLSLWLFYVLYLLQLLVWGSFGVAEEGGTAAVAIEPRSFIGMEEAGGFIALTVVLLYQSRRTIGAAIGSLIGRAPEEPNPSGPLAGRWAVAGFCGANAFMVWWAMRAGMSWWSFALLLGLFYAVLVGASRLVCAGGVMFIDTGFFPRRVVMRAIGAAPIGVPSLTMYTYLSVIFMYDPMNLAMPQLMDSFKLLQAGRLRGGRWPLAALLALLAVLVAGIPALLWVVYHHGASSLSRWPFYSYPQWAFGELDSSLRAPEAPDNWSRLALAVGAGFMLLLVWLHGNFVWWPLSPVGFLIASAYETNRSLWSSVLLAWALTTLIRRYGGLKLYRAMRPAFLGLVLGEYLMRAALAALSSLLGQTQPPT
jgi:hypothetical protein